MSNEVTHFVIYCIPVLSAFLCLFISIFCREKSLPKEEITIGNLLKSIYILRVFSWSLVLCYFYNPPIYARFSAVYFTINLVGVVMLCHYIAIITRTNPKKKFSFVHYIFPILWGIVYQSEILSIPEDILVQVYTSRGEIIPGYEDFSNRMNNGVFIRSTYCMIYVVICIWNVIRYRKFIVNYSSDISRSSLNWVKLLLVLMVIVAGLVGLGTSSIVAKYPSYLLVPVSILFFQHILLCFNTCKRNYVIVWPQIAKNEATAKENEPTFTKIDKNQFEEYIRKERPYRNPSLRITDMILELGTNRTYLSEFINQEYGMNFSTFINLCRLEEMEKIQHESKTKLSNLDLIIMVGFGSYDSYLRTKKRRDEKLLLSEKNAQLSNAS